MHKKNQLYVLVAGLLCFFECGMYAAILNVTSLGDALGSVATLRQTIIDAVSGDTILFDVSGTIVLDEALGVLAIDKQLTIDGQNKIVIDGDNKLNIGFHITGAASSNTVIKNITVQNFNGGGVDPGSGTASKELPAYGVLIDGGAEGCSFDSVTIRNIHSGKQRLSAGIGSSEQLFEVVNSCIMDVSSGSDPFPPDQQGAKQAFGIWLFSGAGMTGDFCNNTIYNISGGLDPFATGPAIGVSIGSQLDGNFSNNTIYNISSPSGSAEAGDVWGANIDGSVQNVTNNTIYNISSGSSSSASGGAVGLQINFSINGNLENNTIHNLSVGTSPFVSNYVLAIDCRGTVNGSVFNNAIYELYGPSIPVGGIKLAAVNDNTQVECNSIYDVSGNGDGTYGMHIEKGNHLTLRNNRIYFIENNGGSAHGLLLGDGSGSDDKFVTNSLIYCNVINTILGSNNNGYGVTVSNDGSVGNDILNNSIFDVNGKAINIETLVDADINLDAIGCFDGCKLSARVSLRSFIGSDNGSEDDEFLIQFFLNDTNTPGQAKTFIGQKTAPAGTSSVRFVPVVPVTFGQFLTATATALPLDSESQNNNTSEVSNPLATCKPNSTFCPCPEIVPDETCVPCVIS